MDILSLIATIVLLSASGALAPGPMFFAVISHGTRSGARGGLAFSIGHTLVEFPLVILLAYVLAYGLLTAEGEPVVRFWIGIAGGIALLVFGAMQIRDSLTSKSGQPSYGGITSRNPLLMGLVFTGLNPFFILWWLTVGGKLILDSLVFASMAGVVFMFICHVWIDYAWLTAVAHFARVGTNVIGTRWYRIVMASFGPALVCFGLLSLYEASFLTSVP